MDHKTRTNLYEATQLFQKALNDSHLTGPKTDEIKSFLAQMKTNMEAKLAIKPTTDTAKPKPERTRTRTRTRKNPVGLFQKRSANITLKGKTIPVSSITEAEKKIYAVFPTLPPAEIAAAIQ